jgi:beta-glucosidase
VLFGDVDPAGRLTTTFPNSVGQVPVNYNHFNTGRPGVGEYKGNYADGPMAPLYPFGFGLTYTKFDFGNIRLDAPVVKLGGRLVAHLTVANTGVRSGTEVVQLYIRALAASAGPRPVRELKGFQKIPLQPGESRAVTFTLSANDLGYYDTKGNWLVEPGKYQLWLAKDSASGQPVDFEVVK